MKFKYIADEVYKLLGISETFLVRVTIRDLYIRKGLGTKFKSKGLIKPGIYTIVEVDGDWES